MAAPEEGASCPAGFQVVQSEPLRILLTITFPAWKFERSAAGISAADAQSIGSVDSKKPAGAFVAKVTTPSSTAFSDLLRALSQAEGADWLCLCALGVEWHEQGPQPCLDVVSPMHTRQLTGRFVLPGFDEVDLPERHADGEPGVRCANEGECSLSAFGDEKTVHEVVLVKYYPTDDVDGLMSRLLTEALHVQPIGSEGSSAEDAVEFLYRIRFQGSGAVYAAITSEEGGRRGPGFTTIVLTRNDPRAEGAGSERGEETSHST